ncbi:MAG: hypothetical protein RMM08_07115, partial [Armatimonadota bacterium]|nr:hypothetical protein [Armatimonadota bacterium]
GTHSVASAIMVATERDPPVARASCAWFGMINGLEGEAPSEPSGLHGRDGARPSSAALLSC